MRYSDWTDYEDAVQYLHQVRGWGIHAYLGTKDEAEEDQDNSGKTREMVFTRADHRHREMELAQGCTTFKTLLGQRLVAREEWITHPSSRPESPDVVFGRDAEKAYKEGLATFVEGGAVYPPEEDRFQ